MMNLMQQVTAIVCSTLHIDPSERTLDKETALLGAIPEFDSMAVVSIITSLEERFGFSVDDDEIDASVFESVGSLLSFVESKL